MSPLQDKSELVTQVSERGGLVLPHHLRYALRNLRYTLTERNGS